MASPLATALMSAEALPRTQIQPTNVGGIYNNVYENQMERYKAQLAQRNAMWGGLAGIGGAALNVFGPGLGTALKGLFSSAPSSPTYNIGTTDGTDWG